MIIDKLSPETKTALMALKRALANEPGIDHAQVTFDQVGAADTPPTLDVVGQIRYSEVDSSRYQSITIGVWW